MTTIRCPRGGHPAPPAKNTGRGMPKLAECPVCGNKVPVVAGLLVQHLAQTPLPGVVSRPQPRTSA